MARQRRIFSTEFKQEAASLVLDQGYSLAEAGRSLDVGSKVILPFLAGANKGRITEQYGKVGSAIFPYIC